MGSIFLSINLLSLGLGLSGDGDKRQSGAWFADSQAGQWAGLKHSRSRNSQAPTQRCCQKGIAFSDLACRTG